MKKMYTAEVESHQLNLIIIKKADKQFSIGFSYFEKSKNEHYIEIADHTYDVEFDGVKATIARARYYLQRNYKNNEALITELWNKYDEACQLKMNFEMEKNNA